MTGKLYAGVSNYELDLAEGISIPFSYSVADIKEPTKRKRNFSRTFKLVGTSRNLQFFSSAFQLSLSTLSGATRVGFDFNPNTRVPASYYSENGLLLFKGLIQLNQVVLLNDVYTFECTMFSTVTDVFSVFGERTIRELGWSEYNHLLNDSTISDSWDTAVVKNGVLTSNFVGGKPVGFGYYYGLVEYGYDRPTPKTWRYNDLFPLVYVREVAYKSLQMLGFTIDSDFFDTDYFRALVMGFSGGEKYGVSNTEANNRRVNIESDNVIIDQSQGTLITTSNDGLTRTFFFIFTSYTPILPLITAELQDVFNQYDTASNTLTVAKTGRYNVRIKYNYDVDLYVRFRQTDGTIVERSTWTERFKRRNTVVITRNGDEVFRNAQEYNDNVTGYNTGVIEFTAPIDLKAGDTVEFNFNKDYEFCHVNVLNRNGTIDEGDDFQDGSVDDTFLGFFSQFNNVIPFEIDITYANTGLVDNETVDVSVYLPDMKIRDFWNSIVKMHNLYISDPTIENMVKIEPLNDYYLPTNQVDNWSDKVDYSKEIKIKPTSSIQGKKYLFQWTSDNDYDNKRYREKYGIDYGNADFTSTNAYAQGEQITKVGFAQTIPTDENFPLIIPRIIQFDEKNNAVKPFSGKPRIYLIGGMKSGTFELRSVSSTTFTVYNVFPSLHHFDDYENPTFDLNFGLPNEVFYTATKVTNNNLFTAFHRKFLREITGIDSKLVELFVRLTPFDINTNDFRKLKNINGVLFRLNEIRDYDSNIVATTEVELIRVIEANNPATLNTVTDDVTGTSVGIYESNKNGDVVFGGVAGYPDQNSDIIYG